MRVLKSSHNVTAASIRKLPGVIVADVQLSVVGPISYPSFIKTRNTLEQLANQINELFPTQKHLEVLCIETSWNIILILRDVRYSSEYFDSMEYVEEVVQLEEYKIYFPELYACISSIPNRKVLDRIIPWLFQQVERESKDPMKIEAIKLFEKEWKVRHKENDSHE